MSVPLRLLAGGCIFVLMLTARPERRRDPLTPPEIDQLRDAAIEPDIRLRLYLKFARARLAAVEQAMSDAKATDRAQQVHDRLQDFLDVYDELNDNVDTYADRRWDMRKVLKTVIDADTEFQAKARALRDSASAVKDEAKQYEFLLSNTIETLDASTQDHRQLLSEQEELAKQKRLVKPESSPR